MAQRGLLTEDDRQFLLGVPWQEHRIIKNYPLSQNNLDLVLRKRGARNQLGFAVHLYLLRYHGFRLRLNEAPLQEMLTFRLCGKSGSGTRKCKGDAEGSRSQHVKLLRK